MATLDSTRKQQQQQRVAAGGFTPLLNGAESDTCVKLRFETYDRLWKDVEERTNVSIKSAVIQMLFSLFELTLHLF